MYVRSVVAALDFNFNVDRDFAKNKDGTQRYRMKVSEMLELEYLFINSSRYKYAYCTVLQKIYIFRELLKKFMWVWECKKIKDLVQKLIILEVQITNSPLCYILFYMWTNTDT